MYEKLILENEVFLINFFTNFCQVLCHLYDEKIVNKLDKNNCLKK